MLPALIARAREIGCALYTFGFGADHDAAMLSEIAEQAQTPFTYVEDTEQIREAFAGTVGGLTSIVAQNLELTFTCHVPLKTVNTPFTVQRPSDAQVVVTIPDVFAGERRDMLVELAVPASGEETGRTVLLEASARYTDLLRNCVVQSAVVTMEAEHVAEPQPEAEPDEEVTVQRERVEVTQALQEAARQSDEGNFHEAQQVLESAGQRMENTRKKSSKSLYCSPSQSAWIEKSSRGSGR